MRIFRYVQAVAMTTLLLPLSAFAIETGLGETGDAAGFKGALTDIPQLVGQVIGVFLSLLGVLFMVLLILAGYEWMTAQGDAKKAQKAKDRIQNSLIGIIIVVMAYAISGFILGQLIQVARPPGS